MGKHISKTKLAGEVALMEVSIQSSIGVRTRARTLALQRVQKPSTFPDGNTSSFSSSDHLLLRGRRLEKEAITLKADEVTESKITAGVESSPETKASLGEFVLLLGAEDMYVSPLSCLFSSSWLFSIGILCSTTRLMTKNCAIHCDMHQAIPSSHEIEEFFSGAERLQQRTFMEKYNYDPVNDCPLPGRYEWVKLDSS
ncbi:Cyclin-dependent kinase inhibitor 4 [Platanthera guangdongensis]|uniref:Cyclin-dependent kinase inhibitor n=1 Tax=Platanthera guangdongensis TaxID=2320717 RepID=A0ABR2MTW4_9ASPA